MRRSTLIWQPARDLAGTLMELYEETFSGIYANAGKVIRWLSIAVYADLVSGDSFKTREICDGNLTIFVQVPIGVLQTTPGFGRIVIGALLNAAYEVDDAVEGCRSYEPFQLSRREGFDIRDRWRHEQLDRQLVFLLKGNKGKG